MSSLAVMGVGCRSGVASDAVVFAVQHTLALAPISVRLTSLHSSTRKSDEAGLKEAAARLALTLQLHSDEYLQAQESRIASRSERVTRLFGIGSVAEAAALCGAGDGARLLVPKHDVGPVSCAIALLPETAG